MDCTGVEYKIAGINHQAWLLEVTKYGRDLYPEIKARAAQLTEPHEDMVRYEIMKRFGYYVTESSQHTAEYTPYFIKDKYPGKLEQYGIKTMMYKDWGRSQVAYWKQAKEDLVDNHATVSYTHLPGKTSEAVMGLMTALHDEYCENFSRIFKTITVDNGSEFADFAQVEQWGTKAFFAHPYTSWERPQNERHNGLFRAFVPKGASIEAFSDEDILSAADELNGRPRKKLGYRTPEELFDAFLDAVFAA